ncbi:hypothetical protein BQ8482_380158 [Mesorhizobium delmotii]|uniref:Uncharacterized protein n=1 Tax=Mesorhizobium delmotii TaxID=1631247 RepID=A0A2P9AS29_9HYPH|nr:hypothetical protein BQ8482_380158 [Mesorhizobium delmotii]
MPDGGHYVPMEQPESTHPVEAALLEAAPSLASTM